MAKKDRGYKRRWRNLLLDVRYQLSYTTLLVGVTAALMVALGWWVKDKAFVATDVAANSVIELQCPDLPALVQRALDPAPRARRRASQNDQIPDSEAPVAAPMDAGVSPDVVDAGAAAEPPRTRVIIEESSIEAVTPSINAATMTAPTLANFQCRITQSFKIQPLWERYRLILYVLFGTSIVLVIGLAFYGIKMTHKVAGPLYKVGLYLDKLAAGKYDTVWNLRKGDQLTEFYEHFKAAHAGLTDMQAGDLEILESVCSALAEVEDKSPELAAACAELEALLEAKRERYQVGDKGK